jgi:hypothetical protein
MIADAGVRDSLTASDPVLIASDPITPLMALMLLSSLL